MNCQTLPNQFPAWAAALILTLCTACEPFPRDPRHSLDQVLERGTLRVGAVSLRPWVTGRSPEIAAGPEGLLVRGFARELGVEVEWFWGGTEQHFEALERYELDLVIAGLTKSTPWKDRIGSTLPYYIEHSVVGLPTAADMITSLEDVTVGLRPVSGLRDKLQARGATVLVRNDLAGLESAVAAKEWEIDGLGLRRTTISLDRHEHVIAVPPGENALLLRLEDFLLRHADRSWIEKRLWEVSK